MEEDIYCPIADALDFFNRKWVFCILMDLFKGKKHFTEFKELNPNLSNFVLSQTLKYMCENDLIKKTGDKKTEYKLTEKGLKTNKILFEIVNFSFEELEYSKFDDDKKEELLAQYKKDLMEC